MKKLHVLKLRALHLASQIYYYDRLLELLATAGAAVKKALAPLMPAFEAELAKEEALLQWARKSEYTAKITAADTELDRVLVAINGLVHTGRHSTDVAVKDAAERVRTMLKHYGYVPRKAYAEKMGDVELILEDFTGPYAADAAALGLTPWVPTLQDALDHLSDLIRRRDDERVKKPRYTAHAVRSSLDAIYRRMADIINASALTGASDEFAALIDRLNPLIDRLNEESSRPKTEIGRGGHTVAEPIAPLRATGAPLTPLPRVFQHHSDGSVAELVLGRDFFVTYRNNVRPGMARLTFHGRGAYKGRFTVTFTIVES
jgi:hypothetical protein